MKDGIFVSLKIPKDFKKRANFKRSHVDAKSFSQPFLRVKGSLGTNWGSFKAFQHQWERSVASKCLESFPNGKWLER